MNTPDIPSTQLDASLIATVEEWSEKLQRGERVKLDDYLARFPDRTAQLRELYATIQAVNQLGEDDNDNDAGASVTASKTLGEFQIVRQVGRGGMGVVYEAHQSSLDRRVALKVLPLASLLGETELARFKNEARAAATLHHPNIVPIYSVGMTDGVHYYAMQFIDGPSLAQVVEQTNTAAGDRGAIRHAPDEAPSGVSANGRAKGSSTSDRQRPTGETKREIEAEISTKIGRDAQDRYRVAARWILQASRAISYAHRSGVLHRDIKPANLLVDRWGNAWVTDFGLARIEGDPSITATGHFVGTLRYLAPEQVLQEVIVDERADIYGLGLTLYELIALKPAFDATRYNDLIQQIKNQSAKSARTIDTSVPRELDVIVSKATQSDREDRYLSAEELADDLQAFLDRRPIKARPLNVWQRGGRWVRHHQRFVAAAVLAFVLATLVLAGTSLVILDQRRTAVSAKERSDQNFILAQEAVDQLLTRVGDNALLHEPHMERLRASLLQDAVEFYDKLATAAQGAPDSQVQVAVAKIKLGRALMLIGRTDQAYQELHEGTAEVRRLLPNIKAVEQTQMELALGLRALGHAAQLRGGHDLSLSQDERTKYQQQAQTAWTQGIELLEKLPGRRNPDADLLLSRFHLDAANELPVKHEVRREHLEKAVQSVERIEDAGTTPDALLQLAMSLDTLSLEMEALGDHDERFALWERALVTASDLVDRYPRHAEGRYFLSCFLGNTSTFGGTVGDKDPRPRSLQLARDLHEEFPAVHRYRWGLAMEYGNLATVAALNKADCQEVIDARQRAVELLEPLWRADPKHVAFKMKLFENLNDLQEYAQYRCDAESRFRHILKNVEIMRKSAEIENDVTRARRNLSAAHMMMAIGLYPLRRMDEAREHLHSAREIANQLIQDSESIDSLQERTQAEAFGWLQMHHSLTAQMNYEAAWGDAELARSFAADALRSIDRFGEVTANDQQARVPYLIFKISLLVAHLPAELRRPEEGLRLARELVSLLPNDPSFPLYQKLLAKAHYANGEYSDAIKIMEDQREALRQRDRNRSLQQGVKKSALKPEDPSYSLYVALSAFHLGDQERAAAEFSAVTKRWGSCDTFPDSVRLYREAAKLLGITDVDSVVPTEPTRSLPPINYVLGRRSWQF